MMGGMDSIFYVGFFVALPILCIGLVLIVSSIALTVSKGSPGGLRMFAWLVILWGIPLSAYFYERAHPLGVSERVRWWARSGEYKSEFQRNAVTVDGELRHSLWHSEGPSFAIITIYLVFDPSDSLVSEAKNHVQGKVAGLPCKVYEVRRLESPWYAVLFINDGTHDECS
jgi:hypothetical protein